jgi:hypothetical protein
VFREKVRRYSPSRVTDVLGSFLQASIFLKAVVSGNHALIQFSSPKSSFKIKNKLLIYKLLHNISSSQAFIAKPK